MKKILVVADTSDSFSFPDTPESPPLKCFEACVTSQSLISPAMSLCEQFFDKSPVITEKKYIKAPENMFLKWNCQ